MSNITSTLYGFYRYDNTLFDSITLPEGINKNLVINTIMMECGEFQPLWTDYTFYKSAINHFFKKWNQTIDKWWTAIHIEYDPLNNYDRYEEISEKFKGSKDGSEDGKTTGKTSDSSTLKTDNTTKDNMTGGSTSELEKSAFDQTTYSPYEKTTVSDSENRTTKFEGDSENKSSGTSSGTSSNTYDENEEHEFSRSAHLYGNIGVTTSQQMLQAELEVAEWNIYNKIADLFATELCIAVY